MYRLLYGIGWTLSLLPLKVMYLFSDFLSFCTWHFSLYRKQVTLTNLHSSFPDKSTQEIRKIARKFYRHFGDQVMESFRLFHMREKQILKRYKYTNPEVMDELYNNGRSVLLATAHYGNWEWLVSLPLLTKHRVLIVYKPPAQKSSDWVYKRFQSRFGGISVELPHLPRTLLGYSSRKELTATFILNDQRPGKNHVRHWNTFLNQDTPWQNGLERLAIKSGQAVVFIHVDRIRRGYYTVTFNRLFDRPEETAPNEITDRYALELEKIIAAKPELWLWTHRRWKLKRIS